MSCCRYVYLTFIFLAFFYFRLANQTEPSVRTEQKIFIIMRLAVALQLFPPATSK